MNDCTPDTPTKQCTKCGEAKPATNEYFHNDKTRPAGLFPQCKVCTYAASRSYREKNKDAIKDRNKRYVRENRERIRPKRKIYYDKTRDVRIRQSREWAEANKDRVVQRRKEYHQKNKEYIVKKTKEWRINNPEKFKAQNAQYHKDNPKTPEQNRVYRQRRAARKQELPRTFTPAQWQRAIEYFGGNCAVCERPLNGLFHEAHADHWIPLSNPESPGTVATNIVPLCGQSHGCNNSKHAHLPAQWLQTKFGKRLANKIIARVEQYFDWVRDQDDASKSLIKISMLRGK